MYCLYLNLIYRNFLFSQNNIFIPIHVVPLHEFSNSSYTTCRFEKPLRGFSVWSYTKYVFEKPLSGFYTYTFEKPLWDFSIWSYTSYTFEKPRNGFSKAMYLRIETTLFLRSCVGDGDGINSTALLNLVRLTFFRSTKPIENFKENMIAELKNPLNTIINTSYSQRTICEAYF